MTAISIILGLYAALSLAYWLRTAYGVVRLRRDVPKLDEPGTPEPERRPKLSVIVPACNEADKIESAFRTLMQQDYPDLELILVNDRSTDGTGEIIDRLAAQDPRVRTIHVSELPEGWLGKVNALSRGMAESTGEFVLFTDADVHFRPGTLRKAIAHCHRNELDHLTAIPNIRSAGFITDTVLSAFLRPFMTLMTQPWAVGDANSGAFVGIGAFNLVRRSAFEATEGFEWLRMETGDDMALGLLMKRSGARCGVLAAFEDVGLLWHRSLAEVIRGSEKAYAVLCRFSIIRSLLMALPAVAVELSPILLLLPLASTRFRLFGLAGIALAAVALFSTILLARWAHVRVLPGVASPLGSLIGSAALVRATVLGRRRDGIVWRGTLYRTAALRKGMRLNLSVTGRLN